MKPVISLQGKINTEFTLTNSFCQELYYTMCPDGCDIGMSLAQTNLVSKLMSCIYESYFF